MILVPILLGLAALVLVVVMLVRLRSRNVVDRYVFVRNQNSKLTKMYIVDNLADKGSRRRGTSRASPLDTHTGTLTLTLILILILYTVFQFICILSY